MPNKDDKKLTEADAREVIAAAKRLFGNREDYNMGSNALNENREDTQKRVKDLDLDMPELDVRIMQVGPNNTLTDVTDKVNPRDIRPDQLADMRTDIPMTIPLGADGRIDKAAAMDLLSRITGRQNQPRNSSEEAMRRMELTLAKSDKMIEHFKD